MARVFGRFSEGFGRSEKNKIILEKNKWGLRKNKSIIWMNQRIKVRFLAPRAPFGLIFGLSCMFFHGEAELGSKSRQNWVFSVFLLFVHCFEGPSPKIVKKKTPVANVAMSFEYTLKPHTRFLSDKLPCSTSVHDDFWLFVVNYSEFRQFTCFDDFWSKIVFGLQFPGISCFIWLRNQ